MYIRRAIIRNIRSIAELEWEPEDEGPGWHVILGDNGSGKSSFLRSIALALVGPKEAVAARQDWKTWLRSGKTLGLVRIDLVRDVNYDLVSGKGRTGMTSVVSALVRVGRLVETRPEVEPEKGSTRGLGPERHVWGTGAGWFSASFGPFRRFTGGDKEAERTFLSNPKLGAHISVFGENVALTEGLYWLRELNYKKLEHSPEGGLLRRLEQFVNQEGFLPHNIKLKKVTSEGVEFEDANGFPVRVEELSDGYRSILSMTFELIRQLRRDYPEEQIFDDQNLRVIVPGVVMIDEIDAHLHPTWQKKVGFWFTEHFPNFQFIVTTHSPLICQASTKGSIFLLPRPGTEEAGRILEGAERDRLVYGDILDAYSTEAFGAGVTRSPEAQEMQERLASLNVKELKHGLSAKEKSEQNRLRAAFRARPIWSMRGKHSMIQIPRRDLPTDITRTLRSYQAAVDAEPVFAKRVDLAAAEFRRRNRDDNKAFHRVRSTLTAMCAGAKRCMYCEDSAADEVEHHRPKDLYPEHVFDWENYLYACGPCNGPKNSRFAVFAPDGSSVDVTRKRNQPPRPPIKGDPILLHPRIENPLKYMMLDIRGNTFLFVPTAPMQSQEFERASYTIQILRLNQRDYLPVARREAYESYKSRLLEYVRMRDAGADNSSLGLLIAAIKRMQHPTVWSEMSRQRDWVPELTHLFGLAPEALTW